MIWTTQPHAIDLRSRNHLLDGLESSRIADALLSRSGGCGLSVRRVWTVHTKHIRIANATPGFEVKLRHETAADESDSQFASCHVSSPGNCTDGKGMFKRCKADAKAQRRVFFVSLRLPFCAFCELRTLVS